MKQIIFSILSITFFLVSCKDNKNSALNFNKKIVNMNKEFYAHGEKFGKELNAAMSSHDFSNFSKVCEEAQKLIDDNITKVEAMENVAGSEEFKKVTLEYFKFEKDMVQKYFMPFKKMNAATTEEEIKQAATNLMNAVKEEEAYLVRARKAQEEYAEKNGLAIEPEE